MPIYQTTSYVFDDADTAAQLFELKQYGNIYTRIGNPTTAVLEERLASLENATGAVAVASGMAAQFVALMTLLSPGDEIVGLVAPVRRNGHPAHAHLPQAVGRRAVRGPHPARALGDRRSRPAPGHSTARPSGNPRGSILDLEPLAALAGRHRIPLIVDNTFATPYLCRPMDWGATIVLHSATKFIGGHGNSIGGVVLESGRFDYSHVPAIADPSPSYHGLRFFDTFGHYGYLMKVRAETVRDTGACLSPTNAFLLAAGARDAVAPDGAARRQRASASPGSSATIRASRGWRTRGWRITPSTRWR